MNPQKETGSETTQQLNPKEFKTMEIQTKPQSNPQLGPLYPQTPSYYNHLYSPIVMLIMSFWQNESNKKFYKNEVLNIQMAQLPTYADPNKVKQSFPSCSSVNSLSLSFKGLQKAEFFILRSTCDDDIHKVC